jgi:hypothetical protein
MKIFLAISIITAVFSGCGIQKPVILNNNIQSTIYNDLSEVMLRNLQSGKNIFDIQEKIASVSKDELYKVLVLDEQRKAFWINIYNGYIISILKNNKELFNDRGTFFTKKQINIAGELLSFDDIENGMIRKSQFKFGLGYIGKIFPPAFERQLRVKQRDFRIHFAINCGAKSCPPVRIYTAKTVNDQLNNAAISYLKANTKYSKENNSVETSTLMSWFRGDFGGKTGAIEILKKFNLIPNDSKPDLTFGDYNWALDLNNYAE